MRRSPAWNGNIISAKKCRSDDLHFLHFKIKKQNMFEKYFFVISVPSDVCKKYFSKFFPDTPSRRKQKVPGKSRDRKSDVLSYIAEL